jgi:hypothetical protein
MRIFLCIISALLTELSASSVWSQNVNLWRLPDPLRADVLEQLEFGAGSKNTMHPFIYNGTPISSDKYPFVVAIKYKGKPYCTGVVIGNREILTAGHCIFQFRETLTKDLTYDNAADVTETKAGKQLCGYAIPTGILAYDPVLYSHDVGIVFTAAAIGLPIARLSPRLANWAKVISDRVKNTVFVGYGLYAAVNDPTEATGKGGAGVKRDAVIPITMVDDWSFYYDSGLKPSTSPATCSGDSGGPTILDNQVIGMTSVGDAACTLGSSTRVDVHLDWITSLNNRAEEMCQSARRH